MLNNIRGKTQYLLQQLGQLGLSEQCNGMRINLIMLITNKNFLSEHLTSQLMPNAVGVPYQIHPADPEQISVLKKLVNILYNVERALIDIERLQLEDNMYLVEFLATSSSVVFKNINSAINQAYEALQLINYGDQTLQAILGAQFNKLKPSLDFLSKRLNEFTPNASETSETRAWGEVMGDIVNILPTRAPAEGATDYGMVGDLLVAIPNFFKKLQVAIETESLSTKTQGANFNLRDQNRWTRQAKGIVADLKLMGSEDNRGILTLKYTDLLLKLGTYSLELINEGAPLTKVAYLKSVEKLNVLKHELLPTLLAEVESLEESLGLKSGLLTQPMMDAMDSYYGKLVSIMGKTHFATTIFDKIEEHGNTAYGKAVRLHFLNSEQEINVGEKIKQDENLETLFDTGFSETYQKLHAEKINEAKSRLEALNQGNRVAMAFFSRIAALNTYANKGQIANISPHDKQDLARMYSQIQTYIAGIDPQLDVQIVNSLNLTANEQKQLEEPRVSPRSSMIQTLWGGLSIAGTAIKGAVFANAFSQIGKVEKQVFNAIQKAIAGENLRLAAITSSVNFPKLIDPLKAGENSNNSIDNNVRDKPIDLSNLPAEIETDNHQPTLIHLKPLNPIKDTVLSSLRDLNLATKIHNYLANDLIPFLEKNLSTAVLESLHLSDKPFPYKIDNKDPGQVQLYKSLLNAFYHLEKGLSQFEKQGDHDYIQGTLERALYLTKLGISLGPALDEVSVALESLGKNAQLATLLSQGLTLINPLKQLPGISFSVDKTEAMQQTEVTEYGSEQFKSIHQFNLAVLNLVNTGDLSKLTENYLTLKDRFIAEQKRFVINDFYTQENEAMIQKLSDVTNNLQQQLFQEKEAFLLEVKNLNQAQSGHSRADANRLQENLDMLNANRLNQTYKHLLFASHQLQTIGQETNNKYKEITANLKEEKQKSHPEEKPDLSSQVHQVITGMMQIKSAIVGSQETGSQSYSKEEIEKLIASIANFNFSPKSLSTLLKRIDDLKSLVVGYSVDKRENLLNAIEGFRIDFSKLVIAEIDNVEANLGLKPGVLALPLSQYFDNFYQELLSTIVDRTAQHDLGLLIDTTPISARIEAEKVRLTRVVKEREAITEGGLSNLLRLDAMDKKLETDAHIFTQAEVKKEFIECYRHLIPYLANSGGFSEKLHKLQVNFLQEQGSELDYRNSFETLMTSLQFKASGIVASLEDREDFEKIISDERLKYLENLLIQVETDSQNKIEEFKRSTVEEIVCKALGHLGPYADSFYQMIKPGLLKENEAFMSKLTRHDDIEAKLKSRVMPQIQHLINQLDAHSKNNVPSDARRDITFPLTEKEGQDLKTSYYKYISANSNHIMLRAQKMELPQHLRDKNPLAQEKYDFINTQESHLIQFTHNHSIEEVQQESSSVTRETLLFTKLIKIYSLVDILIINLEQTISTNLIQSNFYEKFREIRREVNNDPSLFRQKQEEARIYYLSIYPMLAQRNKIFTQDWFDAQVKDLKTLTKTLDLIAPISSKENLRLGRQLEIARAMKTVLVQSEIPPRERVESLRNLMGSEVDKEIKTFAKSETLPIFQKIIEAIKKLLQPKLGKEAILFSKSNLQQILGDETQDNPRENNANFRL